MRNVIQTKNGRHVAVDTQIVFDKGLWETMVFRCSKSGIIKNHKELDVVEYEDEIDARKGHIRMCNKWAVTDLL